MSSHNYLLLCLSATILLIGLFSTGSQAIHCTEDYCDGKTCPEVTEETCKTKSEYPGQYRFEKKGGVCACCPTCIKVIRMLEFC